MVAAKKKIKKAVAHSKRPRSRWPPTKDRTSPAHISARTGSVTEWRRGSLE